MTRKDYIKLAEIIKNNTGLASGCPDPILYKEELLSNICKFLKEDNPNFNEQKFREACE